jgi:hypothetical protein
MAMAATQQAHYRSFGVVPESFDSTGSSKTVDFR